VVQVGDNGVLVSAEDDDDDDGGQNVGEKLGDVGQKSGGVGQRSDDGRPLLTPAERHQYAVKEMERVVHEFELFAEWSCSAQELTGVIVQHVLKLTDVKRKVHSYLSLSQYKCYYLTRVSCLVVIKRE